MGFVMRRIGQYRRVVGMKVGMSFNVGNVVILSPRRLAAGNRNALEPRPELRGHPGAFEVRR